MRPRSIANTENFTICNFLSMYCFAGLASLALLSTTMKGKAWPKFKPKSLRLLLMAFVNSFCVKKGATDSFVEKMDAGPTREVVLLLLSHPVPPNIH